MKRVAFAGLMVVFLVVSRAEPAFAQVAAAPANCGEVNGRLDRLYADLASLRSSIARAQLALDDFQNPSPDYIASEFSRAGEILESVAGATPADMKAFGGTPEEWDELLDAAGDAHYFWFMLHFMREQNLDSREKLRRAAATRPEFFLSHLAKLTREIDELQRAYRTADHEIAALRDISANLRCNTPDTQPATVFLPGTISICHKAACIWPTTLRLVKETRNSGEYIGTDFENNEAKATLQMQADGTFTLYISVASKGFSGTYYGERRNGNVVEGTYHPGPGFGLSDVFKATLK